MNDQAPKEALPAREPVEAEPVPANGEPEALRLWRENQLARVSDGSFLASTPASEIEALRKERDEAREAAAFQEHNWNHERDLKLAAYARLFEVEKERDTAEAALEPFADISDLIDAETEGVSDTDELQLLFHDYLIAKWPVSTFRAARRVRDGGRV